MWICARPSSKQLNKMTTVTTKRTPSVLNTTSLLLQRLMNDTHELVTSATYDVLPVHDYDNERPLSNLTLPCYDSGFSYNDSEAEWYGGGNRKARRDLPGQTDFDAFLYIIIVLSFYAISMVLLMIKYIKREEEEVSLDYYYTEFVKRERFQHPRFKNKMALEREKPLIEKAQRLALKTLVNPTQNIECCRPSKSSAKRQNGSEAARLLGKRNISDNAITHGAGNVAVVESPREEKARGNSEQSGPPDLTIARQGVPPSVNLKRQQSRGRRDSERSRRGRNVFQWSPCYEMESDTELRSSVTSSTLSSPEDRFLLNSGSSNSKDSPSGTELSRTPKHAGGQLCPAQDFVVDIVYTPPETSL